MLCYSKGLHFRTSVSSMYLSLCVFRCSSRLITLITEMQLLYRRTCSQYSTVHSSDTAVNGVSVTVFTDFASIVLLYSEGDYESDSYTVVFQPGETSAELRIPILDDSLGVEGTEDFTAVLSLLFSNVSVIPGSTDVAAVFISDDDETFVEFTPVNYIVNERERVVILNIRSSDGGALNYSVEVDLLPGTAQSECIMRFMFVILNF